MFETYLGTTSGVYRLAGERVEPLGLDSERVWAIHAWPDGERVTVLAGSYGNGMYRGEDGGRTWTAANEGLTASAFRCIAPDPRHPGAILAGAEPARLFRSRDGGRSWSELESIRQIPGHQSWYLPYSPRAGAIRNVYAPPDPGGRVFASVEVGALLRSEDGGDDWTGAPVIEDEDIHYVTGHPSEPDLLYAALGYAALPRTARQANGYHFGGIARSRDGGRAWTKLESDYTRAVLVPPSRPDLVVAGPSPNVGRGGRIVASTDDGDTWEPASQGIDVPMPDMVELFVAAPDDTVWAITSGGRLFHAVPGEWAWRSPLPAGTNLRVESVSFVAS